MKIEQRLAELEITLPPVAGEHRCYARSSIEMSSQAGGPPVEIEMIVTVR